MFGDLGKRSETVYRRIVVNAANVCVNGACLDMVKDCLVPSAELLISLNNICGECS